VITAAQTDCYYRAKGGKKKSFESKQDEVEGKKETAPWKEDDSGMIAAAAAAQ